MRVIQRAAVADAGIFMGTFGRKSGPKHIEDSYSESRSMAQVDLLDRLRGQEAPRLDERLFSHRSVPERIGIQSISSLKDLVAQLLSESDEPMSAAEIAETLLENSSFSRPHIEPNRPRLPRPIASALSRNSQRVIGVNGIRRFEEFKRYTAGWDYGRGRPLSVHSVATLEAFLRQIPELRVYEPSLFLTNNGNLQLGWEDAAGNPVELEFLPDRVEYYIESLHEEDSVGLDNLDQLVNRIRSTTP